MVAAQRLNERRDLTVFGIVTNGQTWQFGTLQRDLFMQLDRSIGRVDAFAYLKTMFTMASDIAEL